MYFCIDCNAEVSKKKIKRCRSCVNKGSNNPNFKKDGKCKKDYFCLDCKKKISYMSGIYGGGKCHSCSISGIKKSDSTKNKLSIRMKKQWANKEFKAKMIKIRRKQMTPEIVAKIIAKLKLRDKSCFEIKMIDIIKKNKLPFKFVGNGKFNLGGFNPDFVSTNSKNRIIEVYYSYFKNKQYGSEDKYRRKRYAIFNKNGYKTIFFNEVQLKSLTEKEIVEKIKRFSTEENIK